MQQPAWHDKQGLPPGRYLQADPMGLTDKGLVGGAGSTFMRMRKGASGTAELAIDEDRERLVALMSIAANRPVAEAEVLPHVEAASAHWQRGDKALANLRIVFAKLPNVSDQTASYRLALAEHLLDNGWSPRGLMIELGLASPSIGLEKYNPNHVPAGHGDKSGQFDFGPGVHRPGSQDGRIRVADGSGEDEKTFEGRELSGETTPKEEIEHGHAVRPPTPVPIAVMRPSASMFESTLDQLSAAASVAAGKVGPGQGPVYGTAVHTEFKAQVQGLGRDDLHVEQSYLNRQRVEYGTPGSVRVDAAEGPRARPDKVYDLKTGNASLTRSRVEQLQLHLPLREDGSEVTTHEVRP